MHQRESNRRGESETALVCIDGRHYPAFKGDTMIADSGCSCHLVRNGECLEELQDIKESISGIGEGQMLATKKGKMRCAFRGANGSTVYQTLSPVKVAQGLQEDLFSITAEISNGGILSSDERLNIVLEYKGGQNIVFDCRCKTRDGWIAGIQVLPCSGEVAKLSSDGVVKHSK